MFFFTFTIFLWYIVILSQLRLQFRYWETATQSCKLEGMQVDD